MNVNHIDTYPNPDLEVIEGNKARWTHADHRRRGFHNLHRIARYGMTFRAAHVLRLEKRMDLRVADLEAVRHLTSLPWFSAMVVVRGQHVLFERYAPDFPTDQPHSIQSITKTILNLIIGRLVEEGVIDLGHPIGQYLPEIGSGYSQATVQQVFNMDAANEYTEDFTDPQSTYYAHEESMGWRLPRDGADKESTQRRFLARIASCDTRNRGMVQYKDANTEVLGWLIERVSNRPLRALLADITDAAGLEGAFHITTDREGFPTLSGGACVSTRDLARYFSLFVRRGMGVRGQKVGSEAFIERSLDTGVAMEFPYERLRYSNHLMVSGRSLGHGGWGGQYAMANLDTGIIGVFFSVTETQHAVNRDYLGPVIAMLETLTSGN